MTGPDVAAALQDLCDSGKATPERIIDALAASGWRITKVGAWMGRDEQAAVRAALEGLRAEVAATGHHIDCAEGCDCGFDAALALIDARLAALT